MLVWYSFCWSVMALILRWFFDSEKKKGRRAVFLVRLDYSFLGEAFSIRFFNFCSGLKVITRRVVMGIFSFVFGLRFGRWFLLRRSKLLKLESFICSSFFRARRIFSKNSLISFLVFRLLSLSLLNRYFDILVFVSVIGLIF